MSEIRLLSTTTVRAASPRDQNRMEMTPCELQFLLLGPIQKGLLFHGPTPSHGTTLIHHLKASLSRTLDFFPPLAGRLATLQHHDNTVSFFLDCNDAGAEFVHAVAPYVTVADILDPVYVPRIVHSFFPLNGLRNHESTSKPLLGVQVTELVDGIFIACTVNHAVADGSSFWHFFNSWSEISRGFDSISRLPVFERWFPDGIDRPIRIPSFNHSQLHDPFVPPPLQERVFHFAKDKIAGLKAKVNAQMETTRISSLQALLAHIWHSILRCGRMEPEQDHTCSIAIGVRARLQPALAEEYWGSAVCMAILRAKSGELVEHGPGWLAWKLNRLVGSYTDDEIRKSQKRWAQSPVIPMLVSVTTNAMTTSSSPRFNVYGNDFGWGKPVAVRSGGGNKSDGKITLFPGAEEGSIDVEACLSPQTLAALADDGVLMEAVAV